MEVQVSTEGEVDGKKLSLQERHHGGRYQGIRGDRCVEIDVTGVYPLYCPSCSSGIFLLGQFRPKGHFVPVASASFCRTCEPAGLGGWERGTEGPRQ